MKLGMNIEHPTSNIQHPVNSLRPRIGCSVFDVGCWMFLFFCFFSLPGFAQAALNDQPALVPAYGEIPPTFWEQNRTVVIIDVIVFLAVVVAVAWEVFRPKPALVLPPEKIAREALTKLQAQPEDGKLLSEVSQILRRYVGTVFGFPGGEMTTAEFCAVISRHKKIGTELSGAIASFLRECDVWKFSPANAATPVNAADRALKIISQTETRREQVNAPAESLIK